MPRAVGKSIVPTKVEALLAKWPTPVPAPNVTTRADGTIVVPATAYTSKNKSASVTVMKSAGPLDAGEQLLHGGCASSVGPPCLEPLSSIFTYALDDVVTTGEYYLTANFTTWHMDQDLSVSVNGAAAVTVPVFYTVGWWTESLPIQVDLKQGPNTLTFSRTSTRALVFKEFLLYKAKQSVQAPIPAYTPSPHRRSRMLRSTSRSPPRLLAPSKASHRCQRRTATRVPRPWVQGTAQGRGPTSQVASS